MELIELLKRIETTVGEIKTQLARDPDTIVLHSDEYIVTKITEKYK